MKKQEFDVREGSHTIEHRSSVEVGDDPILESKHKIFLSHSGVQKEFVEHLCKALEDRCHYPFFDRRSESLPKGKEFPGLIVKAAQQCQLLVVVVSEEYFMSKWPMIELNAFIQASKVMKLNMNVTILPLFYGLSVSNLKDEKRRQTWLEKWETFAKDDPIEGRIKVEDWSFAVDKLINFNGLSYDRELKEIVAYENEIVSHICTLVLPDIKWDDSHVQGNAQEVVLNKVKQIGLSRKYKVKVVGIYGVGGIGKTTTCKTLCNELSSEYEGKVCHVDFDNKCSNSKELWQNALMKLLRRSEDFVRQLGEGECKDVLHKNLFKHRTFLAIDNVWDNDNSIKQAKMFLNTPFHEDSLVVVTARSQSTLALLGIDGDACLEMPELGQVDATSLFLYHATNGEQFMSKEDMNSIEWCVSKCNFCKGDGRGYHYHPLALEVLGRQLGCLEEKPSKWMELLSSVWKFSSFSGENVVFDVLRSSFDLLQPIEKTLFMDVGLFLPCILGEHSRFWRLWIGWKKQLCVVYKRNEFEIQSQLDSLKRKGLLQDADLTSGRINMHDLYREFVTLEAVGKLSATTDMLNREWVLVGGDDGDLSELEVVPAGGCWQKLSRLSIREKEEYNFCSAIDLVMRSKGILDGDERDLSKFEVSPTGGWLQKLSQLSRRYMEERNSRQLANPITSLEGIKWQYFANVLVLQLYGLNFVHGKLNLEGMTCLRSLQLYDLRLLESLEGLESLKHLTSFDWQSPRDILTKMHVVGQFPRSLQYLYIVRQCVLSGSNVLEHCNNLIKLKLERVEVGVVLDLSNCSSLEGVEIVNIEGLQTLLGLTATRSSRLQTLEIESIIGIHIPGLDQLDGLVQLYVVLCGSHWEQPCLLSLTKLQALTISAHAIPAEHCIPHQLQELCYKWWTKSEAPCLDALKQLQVLDFSRSCLLTRMYGMGDLPALRSLDLSGCCALERLPNLSKSRSLEELILDDCDVLQLYEEDFEILATLPLLHPVRFSHMCEHKTIRLDIAARKVLRYLGPIFHCPDSWLVWKEGEWKELELGLLPIKIGKRGIWDKLFKFHFSTC